MAILVGNMDYRDALIARFACRVANKLTRSVIRTLQSTTDGRQSGDDSGLKDLWDEICVQVQSQESVYWNLYLDIVDAEIDSLLAQADPNDIQSIWLQCPAGEEWQCEGLSERCSSPDEIPAAMGDVRDYLRGRLLRAAAQWSNRRIEAYLHS